MVPGNYKIHYIYGGEHISSLQGFFFNMWIEQKQIPHLNGYTNKFNFTFLLQCYRSTLPHRNLADQNKENKYL